MPVRLTAAVMRGVPQRTQGTPYDFMVEFFDRTNITSNVVPGAATMRVLGLGVAGVALTRLRFCPTAQACIRVHPQLSLILSDTIVTNYLSKLSTNCRQNVFLIE